MLRLLLVEDSPDDADLIRFELDAAGLVYEFRQVWSERMLLRALEEFTPTIALSDMYMPGYSGVAALQLLHERLPTLPLFLLSGDPDCAPPGVPALLLDKAHLRLLPAMIAAATTAA
jgi:CheY-like chemotaxis protein